ncbi:BRO-D [Agrotis segetum nucleopolyhedrovirus A]|uniref:BRO-D n=1 Tax=Agrotis segetum nuclear polyhedrosis virus TaxID=1962501 RepID=Q287E9_NPVAS|nr:BRO-D [Agrotis segetum nucleopolyhedrovirus A]AAZ38289.1 BRO-D [Agrotis segetum nucleopolyhedrovirus A]
MAQVKIGVFKFGEDEFELRYVVDNDMQVLFVGKDIARVLKYNDCKQAIHKHVNEKYKCVFEKMGGQNDAPPCFDDNEGVRGEVAIKKGNPLYLQPHTILITKSGVIQLIMKSKLPYAVELQEWLLEEVIPQVLCTGKYQPAVDNGNGATVSMLHEISQSLSTIQRDNEQLKTVIVKKDQQIEQTTRMINRVMADMNRMYTGFQQTMQKKDEQVSSLVEKMVDLSDRAVEYPSNEKKLPILCVMQDGTKFHAITGQKQYVQAQKNKRNIDERTIILEKKRPNPTMDWSKAVETVARTRGVKKSHRSIECGLPERVEEFAKRIKLLFDKHSIANKKTL